uniref:Uncharacterized protein n=1 Tax=Aegilops tauschii subsp. strangulata TaxID=200361 RepID=A0A453ERV4_AEGTS
MELKAVRKATGKPALDGSGEQQAEGGLQQVRKSQAWGRVALLTGQETSHLSACLLVSSLLHYHLMDNVCIATQYVHIGRQ